jgi:hypothetical protein
MIDLQKLCLAMLIAHDDDGSCRLGFAFASTVQRAEGIASPT